MINVRHPMPAELAPLVGRRSNTGPDPLRGFESALTDWLIGRQQRLGIPDAAFAALIGVGEDEWPRLRAATAHYSDECLYTLASRFPGCLPLVVDVARQQDGWSLYDTWLLFGAASLPWDRPSVC